MYKRIRSALHKNNDNTRAQIFRYGFVSIAALAADVGVLYVLVHFFGLHYLVAASISFTGGLFVNYFLSLKWVFTKSRISNRLAEFLIFAAVGVTGLILNDLIIWIFTSGVGLYYLFSKFIATAIVFFWNFFLRKSLIFSRKRGDAPMVLPTEVV